MSQENCSKGKHITQEERIIIANRHQNGEDYKAIANAIHRPSCTVWRELHRNGTLPDVQTIRVNKPRTDARHCKNSEEAEVIKANKRRYEKRLKTFLVHSKLRYNANVAAKKAAVRTKRQTPMLERTRNEELLSFIITTLDSGWTPEQISGRLKLENIYPYVSAVTIRSYIKDHPELGLAVYLPHRGRRYKYKQRQKTEYNQTTKRSIEERPDEVNRLERIGDLEGDTIVGKDKRDRLLTHVDRKTGLVSISRIIGFNANKVVEHTICDIGRVFRGMLQTITYDNGIEFASWRLLEQKSQELNAKLKDQEIVYFAHPFCSSERARNEDINGLIRRFLPKGIDFKTIRDDDILEIESLLNNRPRKRLGWLTPAEYYSANVAFEGWM